MRDFFYKQHINAPVHLHMKQVGKKDLMFPCSHCFQLVSSVSMSLFEYKRPKESKIQCGHMQSKWCCPYYQLITARHNVTYTCAVRCSFLKYEDIWHLTGEWRYSVTDTCFLKQICVCTDLIRGHGGCLSLLNATLCCWKSGKARQTCRALIGNLSRLIAGLCLIPLKPALPCFYSVIARASLGFLMRVVNINMGNWGQRRTDVFRGKIPMLN